MDDSTIPAMLAATQREVAGLLERLMHLTEPDLGTAERLVREGMLAIGARLLEAGVAARGTGKAGPRVACPCGGTATFEGYRAKQVQTLVGGIAVRRAYYACPGCGHGVCPLDGPVGLDRAALSPAARQLAGEFGARLPFAEATALLMRASGIGIAASTLRAVTELSGARQEATVAAMVERAWRDGLAPVPGPAPERLYVAIDGVRILGTDGDGHEAKVGVVRPARRTAVGETELAASYAAGFEPAAAFGRRLALEAHRRGAEQTDEIAVVGDGAAWIWTLAEEHFPTAVHIVDWFHASERIWELARALQGEGTTAASAWAERTLARLAAGDAATLAAEWRGLDCRGDAARVRDEQVTYFTNQASRMAYHRYRADGWDIGSGLVESACKHLIGAREKGPGMRWSVAGANAVAQVRVLLFNDQWPPDHLAA